MELCFETSIYERLPRRLALMAQSLPTLAKMFSPYGQFNLAWTAVAAYYGYCSTEKAG